MLSSSPPAPREEIVALARALVRAPSQASTEVSADSLDGVLRLLSHWLGEASLPVRELEGDDGRTAGLTVTLEGRRPGPVVCLDACLDTAPVGDLASWSVDPFGGEIRDGKLYGRGSADSKIAVSIFVHLARELARAGLPAGTLHVLLDGDEHSGGFAGIKAFVERERIRPDFAAIGYPGNTKLVIGARGFFRAVVVVRGAEAHSGSLRADTGQNAVAKAARLVELLRGVEMPDDAVPGFEAGPRLTVTAIHGGNGFSQIPGRCEVNVDVRLTPGWGADWARALVHGALERLDRELPTAYRSVARETESWPAYRLDPELPPVEVLRRAAEESFGRPVPAAVAGPSNIGNYLACFGIPATCGFGVTYGGLHGADEWVDLATVEPVYRAYRQAVYEWVRTLTRRTTDEALAAVAEPVARTG
jgi:succinyl-diaminopimelate desuccinylase